VCMCMCVCACVGYVGGARLGAWAERRHRACGLGLGLTYGYMWVYDVCIKVKR
jgi:hypothetical protein